MTCSSSKQEKQQQKRRKRCLFPPRKQREVGDTESFRKATWLEVSMKSWQTRGGECKKLKVIWETSALDPLPVTSKKHQIRFFTIKIIIRFEKIFCNKLSYNYLCSPKKYLIRSYKASLKNKNTKKHQKKHQNKTKQIKQTLVFFPPPKKKNINTFLFAPHPPLDQVKRDVMEHSTKLAAASRVLDRASGQLKSFLVSVVFSGFPIFPIKKNFRVFPMVSHLKNLPVFGCFDDVAQRVFVFPLIFEIFLGMLLCFLGFFSLVFGFLGDFFRVYFWSLFVGHCLGFFCLMMLLLGDFLENPRLQTTNGAESRSTRETWARGRKQREREMFFFFSCFWRCFVSFEGFFHSGFEFEKCLSIGFSWLGFRGCLFFGSVFALLLQLNRLLKPKPLSSKEARRAKKGV